MNIEGKVFLAPLAGITDYVFRSLCMEMGADICVSEMVSSACLHYNPKKSEHLIYIGEDEYHTGIQIFGSVPELMGESAESLNSIKPYFTDINMGCSVKKINRSGAGSFLLKDLEKAKSVIDSVVERSSVPVSVKIRLGIENNDSENIHNMIKQTGIAFFTVHGRTAKQKFSGKADWEAIKSMQDCADRPVVGNGDLFDAQTAVSMWDYAGTDGIMIGRGALGNPWIFREIRHMIETGRQLARPCRDEITDMLIRHYQAELDISPDSVNALKRMRKHFHWYTKGFRNIREMRERINRTENADEVFSILDSLKESEIENLV